MRAALGQGRGLSTGGKSSRPRARPAWGIRVLRDVSLRSGRFRRGARFLAPGEPLGDAPLLPREHLPPQAPSCHHERLPAVPGAWDPPGGQLGGLESRFLTAGGWQQLLCIMESYL